MKKILGIVLIITLVLGVSGIALARMGGPGMGFGPGAGGPCWSGAQGQPGAQPGPGFGPRGGMMGRGNRGPGGTPASATPIDEAKAKEIANEYVAKHLANYRVEKFIQFQRPRGPMYQVELKGPQNEVTYLHITPWGGVRAFPARTF
ncbi:MAG: hypothetical protein ACE147_09930 [Candidatus Methylomirabilales bacterium]